MHVRPVVVTAPHALHCGEHLAANDEHSRVTAPARRAEALQINVETERIERADYSLGGCGVTGLHNSQPLGAPDELDH